jgi:hypothetical protein
MRAKEFVTERKKRKKKNKPRYGYAAFGWYGLDSGYSGDGGGGGESRYTDMELAVMEGGHSIDDLDEAWSAKYKRSINCNNPKGFSQKAHCAGRKKNENIEEISRRDFLRGTGVAAAGALGISGNAAASETEKLTIVMDYGKTFDITNFEGATAKDKWNNFNRAIEKVYAKHDTPIPNYVLKRGDKTIARSTSTGNIHYKPKNENFADGKVKGKSRPGRVKKAGASCNGSVTDLRAKAKNASGEKAKMYHWCANMKSGRNK